MHSLPALLQGVYAGYKPEITTASRCAATFDASGDADHMVLKCSIYIRMAAEGARRAMQYCEEERIAKHISQPCKLVIE